MPMSYTTLIAAKTVAGSIRRDLNASQIDPEVIIEEAEALLYSALRVREQRTLATLSLALGDSTEPLPSDFLDPIGRMRDTKNLRYLQVTEGELVERRLFDSGGVLVQGQPMFWAIFDELFQFDMKFAEATTLHLAYYKRPAALSGGSPTNFVTSRYPHLLRQACKVAGHSFMKNWTGHQTELALLGPLIDRANAESDLSYRGADYDTESP